MLSGVGTIRGTTAYMSPEQARGRPADQRSDIWALGCVLYEMLTGRRSFDGDDLSDALASVIKTDPDWSRLPAETPSGIRRLLKRCLAKDPNERLHAIATHGSRSTTRYARQTPPPPIRLSAYLEARSHRGGADRRHRRRRQSILFSGRQVDRFLGIWRIKKSSR